MFCHPFPYFWSLFSFIVQFIVSLRHHALFLCHCVIIKGHWGFIPPSPTFCSCPHFCTLWNKIVWEVLFFSVLQRGVCLCVCTADGVWEQSFAHRASVVNVSGNMIRGNMNMMRCVPCWLVLLGFEWETEGYQLTNMLCDLTRKKISFVRGCLGRGRRYLT